MYHRIGEGFSRSFFFYLPVTTTKSPTYRYGALNAIQPLAFQSLLGIFVCGSGEDTITDFNQVEGDIATPDCENI
jgi:hypothetical protein